MNVRMIRARPTRACTSLLLLIPLLAGCVGAAASPSPSPRPAASASPSATPAQSASPRPTESAAPSPTATAPASESPSASAPSAELTVARADVPRGPATDADANAAGRAINEFAFDLHRALATEDENLVFSPASIAIALGMARAGARGETAAEMDRVLREVASDENAAWLNALDQALAQRSKTVTDDEGTPHELTLALANAYFAQRDYAFRDAYLEALATRFGAGMYLVDYVTSLEDAIDQINAWAEEQTRGRIPEVLKPDDLSSDTRLALVNAIYLKAPWYRPFQEDQTTTVPFTRPDGSAADVAMMNTTSGAACATGKGWGAMEIPYIGNELSMVVIVPDDLAAFEAELSGEVLDDISEQLMLQGAVPQASLPRFDIETRTEMNDVLAGLGMPSAFDSAAADFTAMTDQDRLYIGTVIHQANISVDEKGTEAAAVTVVGMDTGGGPTEVCTVVADRPFLYAVRDRATGAILFMGHVVDPTG